MSDLDENGAEESEGIKNLRKQYEAIAKQNKELTEQLGMYQAKERSNTVGDILKAKGFSPKAATFYTADDVSEDAVGKWVEEHGDVLVKEATSNGESNSQQRVQDANALAAQRLIGEAQPDALGIAAPAGNNNLGDPQEVLRAIQTLPMAELQKLGYMPTEDPFNPGHFS